VHLPRVEPELPLLLTRAPPRGIMRPAGTWPKAVTDIISGPAGDVVVSPPLKPMPNASCACASPLAKPAIQLSGIPRGRTSARL
jgi:hypothetical protein